MCQRISIRLHVYVYVYVYVNTRVDLNVANKFFIRHEPEESKDPALKIRYLRRLNRREVQH
jgi:hypothetical protein